MSISAVSNNFEDATDLLGRSADEIFSISTQDLAQIQLTGIRKRLSELTPRLPALKRLADENRLFDVHEINELVPLLFPHTASKSYPLSLIDNSRFGHLNAWLNDYTTHELSNLDVSKCETLDEWLDVIEAQTPVRVVTSSGTSGKLSLIPKSTAENKHIPDFFRSFYSPFRDEPGIVDPFAPHIYHLSPHIPQGRHNSASVTRNIVQYAYRGDQSRFITPTGVMSTDLLWMTGRIKKALTEGSLEQLKKTKAWRLLSTKTAAFEAHKATPLDDFFCETLRRLQGKTVITRIGLNHLVALVEAAERGNVLIDFAPDSFITLAGGLKGTTVTDQQLQKMYRALPLTFNELYASTELMSGLAKKCPRGHYHAPPWLVHFVLDPKNGVPYARQGTHTGRYAAFDLIASTYWGGFITGDEVTINWDGDCGCGRKGPYMHGTVVRYSERDGGDDKITCQRTAAAMEEMMQLLGND